MAAKLLLHTLMCREKPSNVEEEGFASRTSTVRSWEMCFSTAVILAFFLCLYRDRFNLLWVGWWILQCDCSLSHAYGLSFSKKLPWFVCILWSKCQLVILFSQRQVNNIKNYSATSTLLFHCQVALPVNSSCINSVWCFVANKVIIYLLS